MKPEQKEELAKAAAFRAKEEGLHRQRLQDNGQIEFELIPADDDPRPASSDYQTELHAFYHELTAAGVPHAAYRVSLHSVEAHDYTLGRFVVLLKDVVSSIAAVLIAWLKIRVGRQLKITVNGEIIEVTANRAEDAEHAIERVMRLKHELTEKKQDE
jgi:hypothetical protein